MAEEYTLLKSQKNEVFEIIQEQGLEPANFSWITGEYRIPSEHILTRDLIHCVYEVPKLIYQKNSQFYFQFELRNGRLHCTFSPSKDTPITKKLTRSWEEQKRYVKLWANCLKKEIEAPDLWAEIEKYRTTLPLLPGEQLVNEPIPAYEVEEIASKLNLLADKVEEQFKLTNEQNQFVRSKLNYLADAAKRQPRRDWENIFIAVIINIAFNLALEPAKAQQFWQLVKSIIGPFIHLIGP